MGKRTTDEVYDQLTEVKQTLDKNTQNEVTTSHFDSKIADLKTAIQNGGKKQGEEGKKKEEEQPGAWDTIKGLPLVNQFLELVKQFLDVASGKGIVTQLVLFYVAVTGALAFFATIRAAITKLLTSVKNMTLAYSGRKRTGLLGITGTELSDEQRKNRRGYIGRKGGLKLGWKPDDTQTAEQADAGTAQRPNLPSVDEINRVKSAMELLNTEVGTYRDKVRGLATPSAMRKMASAAKKLESAAKQHQSVDTLATSVRNLNTELRALAGIAN